MDNVLLHCSFDHISARELYYFIENYLNERRFRTKFHPSLCGIDLRHFDFLISHDILDPETHNLDNLQSYCGRWISRPKSLKLLQKSGISTMNWSLASNETEVANLFDLWNTEILLLKRSYTWSGHGVYAFEQDQIANLRWDSTKDIFCEYLKKSGVENYIYKAEIFNGKIVISWKARCSHNLNNLDGIIENLKSSRRKRSLFRFPIIDILKIKKISRDLTDLGYGYSAIEFMKDDIGKFRAIELDTGYVGTWWTSQFDFVKHRYARSIYQALQGRYRWL